MTSAQPEGSTPRGAADERRLPSGTDGSQRIREDQPETPDLLFWSLDGLSRQIGLKPDTLRKHCCAGRIPGARRIGGTWVIHRATFERSFSDGGRVVPIVGGRARRARVRNLKEILEG